MKALKAFIGSKCGAFVKNVSSNPAIIVLLLSAIVLFVIGYYILVQGFLFQLFNSLSISMFVVILIDLIWRWDNTEKMIARIFEIGMPFFVKRMNELGLHEVMLATVFPGDVGEKIAQDTEIKKYATAAVNSFKDSLSDCQFYESVNWDFTVRMGKRKAADYESSGRTEPAVFVDIECTEDIRRFGEESFKIHHEGDVGVKVDIKSIHLRFGDVNLSLDEDFKIEGVAEKDRMLNEDSEGWSVRFLNDRWKEYETLTVKYSTHFDDHDHWTEINWAGNHPIRKMRSTVVCRDGLSLQESAEITDKNHKIKIEPNDKRDKIRISSDWLMPGQGYVLIISNQEKRAPIPTSGVVVGS